MRIRSGIRICDILKRDREGAREERERERGTIEIREINRERQAGEREKEKER